MISKWTEIPTSLSVLLLLVSLPSAKLGLSNTSPLYLVLSHHYQLLPRIPTSLHFLFTWSSATSQPVIFRTCGVMLPNYLFTKCPIPLSLSSEYLLGIRSLDGLLPCQSFLLPIPSSRSSYLQYLAKEVISLKSGFDDTRTKSLNHMKALT
uniref:Uncharacterized protein n=1 Tax=Trichobilharzia regenti TaxID=157069 RepID=A0AA85JZS1_TRIRE|nr:unnamed protein product [Trichobilharzia regenti]